jgi:hypothetical protein
MSVKMSVLAMMVLGAVLGLAACNGNGGDGGDAVATPTPDSTPTAVPSPPPDLCPKVDDEVVQSIIAILELDNSSYEQGEPIEMTLRLVNCASRPVTRTFPNAQRYDFSMKILDGDEVWRWSDDMAFAEVLGEETYQPAEQVTFVETWDQLDDEGQQVEPGQYELTTESTGCDESQQNCGPIAVRFIEITAP